MFRESVGIELSQHKIRKSKYPGTYPIQHILGDLRLLKFRLRNGYLY